MDDFIKVYLLERLVGRLEYTRHHNQFCFRPVTDPSLCLNFFRVICRILGKERFRMPYLCRMSLLMLIGRACTSPIFCRRR